MTNSSYKQAAKDNVILTHGYGDINIRQAGNDLTFIKGFQVPFGYICLTDYTKTVKYFRISEYLAKKSTKEYLTALSNEFGIPEDQLVRKNSKLGTWVHEMVMLDVVGGFDASFRLWAYQAFRLTGQGRLVPSNSKDEEARRTAVEVTEKYNALMKEHAELKEEHQIVSKEWCVETNNADSLHARSLSLAREYMELYDLLHTLGKLHKAGVDIGEAVYMMLGSFYKPNFLISVLDRENKLRRSVMFDDLKYSPLQEEFEALEVLSHERFQSLCHYVDMGAALEKLEKTDSELALDLKTYYFADPLDAEAIKAATKYFYEFKH